jgi:hypothetical protein
MVARRTARVGEKEMEWTIAIYIRESIEHDEGNDF